MAPTRLKPFLKRRRSLKPLGPVCGRRGDTRPAGRRGGVGWPIPRLLHTRLANFSRLCMVPRRRRFAKLRRTSGIWVHVTKLEPNLRRKTKIARCSPRGLHAVLESLGGTALGPDPRLAHENRYDDEHDRAHHQRARPIAVLDASRVVLANRRQEPVHEDQQPVQRERDASVGVRREGSARRRAIASQLLRSIDSAALVDPDPWTALH